MGRLEGKVAIITGAASGMGLSAVELFTREGAKVVATDITTERLEERIGKIAEQGFDAIPMKLDVSDAADWQQVVDATLATYGKIDILVNNAGVHLPKGVLDHEVDDWNFVMAVNTTGVWLGMKAVIPHMKEIGGGSIVNCSSIAGIMGGSADGHGAAYSASKGALSAPGLGIHRHGAGSRPGVPGGNGLL